jgi:hypothetical protein
MTRAVVMFGWLALTGLSIVGAQAPPPDATPGPAFEAVSIRRNTSGRPATLGRTRRVRTAASDPLRFR